MKRCYCRSCTDRDQRRFWRIVDNNYSPHERRTLQRAVMFPPVPTWDGEPRELHLSRRRAQ